MIPFQVYASRGREYLAVTPTLGLRIEKRKKLSTKIFRIVDPVHVKTFDVQLLIETPKSNLEKDALKANIELARNTWTQLGMTGSLESRKLFFQAVIAACSYFDKKHHRHLNLRDVARLIGIKSFPTFYKMIALEARRQCTGREKSIASAHDITLIRSVRNFQKLWPSLIGFSPRIDKAFIAELKLYTSAMRARSLSLES